MGMFDFVVRDNQWGRAKAEREASLEEQRKARQAELDQKFGREAQGYVASAEEEKRKDDLKRMLLGANMIASEGEIGTLKADKQEALKQQLEGIRAGTYRFVDPNEGKGYASKDAFLASEKRREFQAEETRKTSALAAAQRREGETEAANKILLAAQRKELEDAMKVEGSGFTDGQIRDFLAKGDAASAYEVLVKSDAPAEKKLPLYTLLEKMGAGKQLETRSRTYQSASSIDPKTAADLVEQYYQGETGGVDELAIRRAGNDALERVKAGITGDQSKLLEGLYDDRRTTYEKEAALRSKEQVAQTAGAAAMVGAMRRAEAAGDMAKANELRAQLQYRAALNRDKTNLAIGQGHDAASLYGADQNLYGRLGASQNMAMALLGKDYISVILDDPRVDARFKETLAAMVNANQGQPRTGLFADRAAAGAGPLSPSRFVTASQDPSYDMDPTLAAKRAELERLIAARNAKAKSGRGAAKESDAQRKARLKRELAAKRGE